MIRFFISLFLCTGLAYCQSEAKTEADKAAEKTENKKKPAELQLNMPATKIAAGESLEGSITINIPKGWHTYSDPPGDSGMPPDVRFTLPEGWKVKRLPLPPAKEFKDEAGVTFGYEDSLTIKFKLTAPEKAAAGSKADIKISVQWLICKDACIPKEGSLRASLNIAEK